MSNYDFKNRLELRTKNFAVELIIFFKNYKLSMIDAVIIKQLVRSATSIGANYREANRAVSKNDFINKIGIVEKESSETKYWLEIIERTCFFTAEQKKVLDKLNNEAFELLAIFSTISRRVKKQPENS